ncbi:DUF1281 domain-containing protein [Klebsiella oxytoca]|uniref:DUF1281 domain-containing protein n=1 Tax=Klebsiella oxytoca TaxID=571 RepID=UPI00190EFF5B|nr:DUF1281 domain-containing protein [Klebsiella oxytoca]
MPNWCANRLMFSGVKTDNDTFRKWVKGGGESLYQRARKEGIQLLLAGCAGILRPAVSRIYLPFPAVTAHGAASSPDSTEQAFTLWLAHLAAGSELDTSTCEKLHQIWLDCDLRHSRWLSLDDYAQDMVTRLYNKKSFDWSDSLRPLSAEAWWNSVCDGAGVSATPMDFREILPSRLDSEINGFNGGLLEGISSSYDLYTRRYGCKWPVGHTVNICHEGENTLTVDFDTPWSPVGENVVSTLSERFGAEVEHWYAEQGCNYCGYARYRDGELESTLTGELEWGEEDPDDEDSFPDVIGPEWLLNNVANFGG